ncbi:hypothetical protein BKM31_44090 [[Actinomadura] parvosata subsp. kistnae]|uniref:Uncharacterized protein n=1 Tax=[Actinomadura] parvosata subsp. kistnae TaxID=1909395 RepID=A0A1V0ABL0_9ACTN|nr:hypothetical protein BKM31_44090 [Nonomuraea sp. ATCC 55076]
MAAIAGVAAPARSAAASAATPARRKVLVGRAPVTRVRTSLLSLLVLCGPPAVIAAPFMALTIAGCSDTGPSQG